MVAASQQSSTNYGRPRICAAAVICLHSLRVLVVRVLVVLMWRGSACWMPQALSCGCVRHTRAGVCDVCRRQTLSIGTRRLQLQPLPAGSPLLTMPLLTPHHQAAAARAWPATALGALTSRQRHTTTPVRYVARAAADRPAAAAVVHQHSTPGQLPSPPARPTRAGRLC
jgi:hypothetical protein